MDRWKKIVRRVDPVDQPGQRVEQPLSGHLGPCDHRGHCQKKDQCDPLCTNICHIKAHAHFRALAPGQKIPDAPLNKGQHINESGGCHKGDDIIHSRPHTEMHSARIDDPCPVIDQRIHSQYTSQRQPGIARQQPCHLCSQFTGIFP